MGSDYLLRDVSYNLQVSQWFQSVCDPIGSHGCQGHFDVNGIMRIESWAGSPRLFGGHGPWRKPRESSQLVCGTATPLPSAVRLISISTVAMQL